MIEFNYAIPYEELDLRKEPHLYRIGRSEQGALMVQPYKAELLPCLKTKTVAEARASADKILEQYINWARLGDFPGCDMSRKYLQMGFSIARRYANHSNGKKYDKRTGSVRALSNTVKSCQRALCATIFKTNLNLICLDQNYREARIIWRSYEEQIYNSGPRPVPSCMRDYLSKSAKSVKSDATCMEL